MPTLITDDTSMLRRPGRSREVLEHADRSSRVEDAPIEERQTARLQYVVMLGDPAFGERRSRHQSRIVLEQFDSEKRALPDPAAESRAWSNDECWRTWSESWWCSALVRSIRRNCDRAGVTRIVECVELAAMGHHPIRHMHTQGHTQHGVDNPSGTPALAAGAFSFDARRGNGTVGAIRRRGRLGVLVSQCRHASSSAIR